MTKNLNDLHAVCFTSTEITVAENLKFDAFRCESIRIKLLGTDLMMGFGQVYYQPKLNKKVLSIKCFTKDGYQLVFLEEMATEIVTPKGEYFV